MGYKTNLVLHISFSFYFSLSCSFSFIHYCIDSSYCISDILYGFSNTVNQGAQWLSGRVFDSRPKGSGFEPHRRHCVVVLEQDTFILV